MIKKYHKRQQQSNDESSKHDKRRKKNHKRSSSSQSSESRKKRHHQRKKSRERQRNNHATTKQNKYSNHKRRYHSPSPSSSPSSSESSSSFDSSSSDKRRQTPHYKYRIGQTLGHKYKVVRLLGTGTFGRVVQAKYKDELFAVKIIKPVQRYISSAKIQESIVKALNKADPECRSHIVRFKEAFYHYQCFCMVFESLGASIYDIIKKNKRNGFPLWQVQAFARQIFKAVGFMHSLGFTHTDLKPQNILLCADDLQKAPHPQLQQYLIPINVQIKLIDFGGATHKNDKHSSIINTRQYRAPQVILECCQWKESSDVWSIGCIIPQLLTGSLLFPTHDDFEHLLMITENAKKKIPAWMSKNCRNKLTQIFVGEQIDQSKQRNHIIHWQNVIGLKCVEQILNDQPQLCDLVTKCLQIDPSLRITCQNALKHPFFDLKLN